MELAGLSRKAAEYTDNLVRAYGNHCSDEVLSRYASLIDKVVSLIQERPDANMKTLIDTLFLQSGVKDVAEELVNRDKRCAGFVFAYGTARYQEILVCGDQQQVWSEDGVISHEGRVPMSAGSIFDLASVTKILTCFTIMRLADKGVLDIEQPVSVYDDRFSGIADLTLEELMCFDPPLRTAKRLDGISQEEAMDQLFNITYLEGRTLRPYSDMGAMVLKYIIERVTGQDFADVVRKELLTEPWGRDFFTKIPRDCMERVVCNNYERKIISNKFICDCTVKLGVVHDPKARVLEGGGMNSSGHAGFFATAPAVGKLSAAILSGGIIEIDSLKKIGTNHVGYRNDEGRYSQYLGMLCHTKHPIESDSEVYELLSQKAFAIGGYTGNHYMLDSENEIYSFFASNRCHNRVTSIQNSETVCRDGDGRIMWEDGKSYCDATKFAWDRDRLIHRIQDYLLQLRFLEFLSDDKVYDSDNCIRYI